ncbi:RAD55 family ATPase [Salinigranum salinum]|uniref:RAD55 family ATPase n=1 Tax=Salinigranum salinum TaxID=1364937 RepID=UPI001260F361|nr:ATPase domain-containing protein [Salinigranum salinum]
MTDSEARLAIGDPVLDEMLGGGVPSNRAVLVTGGPGTGKSTLAMQFLQTGLAAGEDCLYVSTEQTIDELRDSFSSFSFDVDHEHLTFVSIHATLGQTVEGDEELTLQSLDDDEVLGPGFEAPFTGKYIRQYLERHVPCDRVVFDSASGLSVVSDDEERYRRTVLDLIRFFTDEADATTLFTAESYGNGGLTGSDLLRFTTHGVVELSRHPVRADTHRFLEITKMRGVDHDRRRMELEITTDGVRVGPLRRSQPPALKGHTHRPIGLPGLDALCGGGLVRGAGVLLQHDGRANLAALFSTLLSHAFETDHTVTLVPTIGLRQSRVESLLAGHDLALDELLAEDRLFVVDLIGAWDRSAPNVYAPRESETALTELLSDLDNRTDLDRFHVVNADAIAHAFGDDEARQVRYFEEAQLIEENDTLLHVSNPDTIDDQIGAFYRSAADQVLDIWLEDDGLQYVTLRKSPCGFVGSTSLVEYVEEPPFLRVQHPPGTRENPYACE